VRAGRSGRLSAPLALIAFLVVPAAGFAQEGGAAAPPALPDEPGYYYLDANGARPLVPLEFEAKVEEREVRNTRLVASEPGEALRLHVLEEQPTLLIISPEREMSVSLHPLRWLSGTLPADVQDPIALEPVDLGPGETLGAAGFRPAAPLDVGVYVVVVQGETEQVWSFARSRGAVEVSWLDRDDARARMHLNLSLQVPADQAAARDMVLQALGELDAEPRGGFDDGGLLLTEPRMIDCGFFTRCRVDVLAQHAVLVRPVNGGSVVQVATLVYGSGTVESGLAEETLATTPKVEDPDRGESESVRLLRQMRQEAGLGDARPGRQPGEMPAIAATHFSLGVAMADGDLMAEQWPAGLAFSGGVESDPLFRVATLRGDFFGSVFFMDEDRFREETGLTGAEVSGGSLTAMGAFVSLKLTAPLPIIRPYALGGVGMTIFDISDVTISMQTQEQTFQPEDVEPAYGVSYGVGLHVDPFRRFGAFGELFRSRNLGGDHYSVARIGVRFVLQ